MTMMFFENENARCGKCHRILFKKIKEKSKICGMEIKCHSCKELNYSDELSFKMAVEKKYENGNFE